MSHPHDFFADLDRLRRPDTGDQGKHPVDAVKAATSPKPGRIKGEFLKGPIPLPWLTAVTKLSGKAPLAVALAVWFEAGRRKSDEVKLTTAILKRFSVNRKAKYRALKALEVAGLVRVVRQLRRNPVVTILDYRPPSEPGDAGATSDTTPAAAITHTITPAVGRDGRSSWLTS